MRRIAALLAFATAFVGPIAPQAAQAVKPVPLACYVTVSIPDQGPNGEVYAVQFGYGYNGTVPKGATFNFVVNGTPYFNTTTFTDPGAYVATVQGIAKGGGKVLCSNTQTVTVVEKPAAATWTCSASAAWVGLENHYRAAFVVDETNADAVQYGVMINVNGGGFGWLYPTTTPISGDFTAYYDDVQTPANVLTTYDFAVIDLSNGATLCTASASTI